VRSPHRIGTIILRLKQVWDLFPDLRLLQLLNAILQESPLFPQEDLFYLEDDDLLKALDKVLASHKRNKERQEALSVNLRTHKRQPSGGLNGETVRKRDPR
jgi:hypothetical protein